MLERKLMTPDGRERRYVAFVPQPVEGERSAAVRAAGFPLVMVFHGGGGTPEIMADATRFPALGEREAFVSVFPEGCRPDPERKATFLRNPPFWNAGLERGFVWKERIDDVGFTARVLEQVAAEWPIDLTRVYVCGFSNGAAMAMRVGVELSRRVAAVAAVAGHLWIRGRRPERPVPLLYMTGTADPLNPIDGGSFDTPWGTRERKEPLWGFLHDWAEWIGASRRPVTVRNHDGIRILRHRAATGNAEVLIYLLDGVGHVWPGGLKVLHERYTGAGAKNIRATDVIWSFFKRFSMSRTGITAAGRWRPTRPADRPDPTGR